MKIAARALKRITMSLAFLFSYDVFVSAFGIGIAVNPFSIATTSILGIPGFISMVILKLIIK